MFSSESVVAKVVARLGTLVTAPCSHVGHIFRKRSPYKWLPGVNVVKKNAVRVAEVWLDEYKVSVDCCSPPVRNVRLRSVQKYYYERFNYDLVRCDGCGREWKQSMVLLCRAITVTSRRVNCSDRDYSVNRSNGISRRCILNNLFLVMLLLRARCVGEERRCGRMDVAFRFAIWRPRSVSMEVQIIRITINRSSVIHVTRRAAIR